MGQQEKVQDDKNSKFVRGPMKWTINEIIVVLALIKNTQPQDMREKNMTGTTTLNQGISQQ
jgi:hypothetical protein